MLPTTKRVSLLFSVLVLTGLLLVACAPCRKQSAPCSNRRRAHRRLQPLPQASLNPPMICWPRSRHAARCVSRPMSTMRRNRLSYKEQQRAATTKCGADELTANQVEGLRHRYRDGNCQTPGR